MLSQEREKAIFHYNFDVGKRIIFQQRISSFQNFVDRDTTHILSPTYNANLLEREFQKVQELSGRWCQARLHQWHLLLAFLRWDLCFGSIENKCLKHWPSAISFCFRDVLPVTFIINVFIYLLHAHMDVPRWKSEQSMKRDPSSLFQKRNKKNNERA